MAYGSATDNLYRVLGVDPDASAQAIKLAYRRIALDTHPDRRPDDPEAAERFRLASRAYEILRDPQRRRLYDRLGTATGDAGILGDLDVQLTEAVEIFSRTFGASVEARDTGVAPAHAGHAPLPFEVTFEDVERGGERRVPRPCERCRGTGARDGAARVRCTACGGSGQLRLVEEGFLGPKIRKETCDSCRGTGRRPLLECSACEGTGAAPGGGEITVRIPRGVREGDTLRAAGATSVALVARMVEDPRWARDGADLYMNVPLPYEVAVLGGAVDVDLPGRTHRLRLPGGTGSGHRLRIEGEGLPRTNGDGRGELVLTLQIAVPRAPGAFQRWLLRLQSARSTGDVVRLADGTYEGPYDWAVSETRRRWVEWKEMHEQSTVDRIEAAAGSLRSAAVVVQESDTRVGPLLEESYKAISSDAAKARRRLDSLGGRERHRALATAVMNLVLGLGLAAALWWSVRQAVVPGVAPPTLDGWWPVVRASDPLAIALAPFLAGVVGGALEQVPVGRLIRGLLSVPLVMVTVASGVATGLSGYVLMLPALAADGAWRAAALAWMLAAIGVVLTLGTFMIASAMVQNFRNGLAHLEDRRDRNLLRSYDQSAARLGEELEKTGVAFRQLLVHAEDDRHPLASLLSRAADTLSADGSHRSGAPGASARALAALVRGLAIAAAWTLATASAVYTAVGLVSTGWLQPGLAAAMAALCAMGALLPPSVVARAVRGEKTTLVAILVALSAVAGLALEGPADGWLALAAAAAAITLSFRLPAAARASAVAGALMATGTLVIVLAPVAAVRSIGRARRAG